MANNKTQCFTCNKEKITYRCRGCLKEFCLMDLTEHQQRLKDELNCIINDYDEFKERINEQKLSPQNHSLREQINLWEKESIKKIQHKAQECRENLIKSSQICINDIEMKYKDLNEQIKQIRKENVFNEISFDYLRNQLMKMTQELNNLSNMSIQQDSKSFINEISIIFSKKPGWGKWEQNPITVAGGNGPGQELNQLSRPFGIFIDENKNIFIADHRNDRIVEWKYNAKEGQIIAGRTEEGKRTDQLNYPTDVIVDQQNRSIIIADSLNRRVIRWLNQNQQILIHNIDCYGLAIDKNGFLYISDYKKNEVRRWRMGEYNNEGIIVAGGNEQGNKLNQFSYATFLFVNEDESIYVSDTGNHRVMKWRKDSKEGRIVAGGNGQGRNRNQLSSPRGVIVDYFGQIYVANYFNHRIMRWSEGKEEGEIVVGGNQLNHPNGLSFDNEGNLYVADYLNNRIINLLRMHVASGKCFLCSKIRVWGRLGNCLQSSYRYAIFDSYGLRRTTIERIYLCANISTLTIGTLTSSLSDKYGRRTACILSAIFYIISCLSLNINVVWIFFIGSAARGIAHSLYNTNFEAWLVQAHHNSGSSTDSLKQILANSFVVLSVVAIAVGFVSEYSVDLFGYVAPFDIAIGIYAIMLVFISTQWAENYGDKEASTTTSFITAFQVLRNDPRIVLVGLITVFFEVTLYIYGIEWTPALQHAIRATLMNYFSIPRVVLMFVVIVWHLPFAIIFTFCGVTSIMAFICLLILRSMKAPEEYIAPSENVALLPQTTLEASDGIDNKSTTININNE
ncbi:unnamed protein product [Adineta steineri]|uniref:Uncharacterized protein n=1 Tax=Adineta steineri TaxID=433720 RepID=A0A818ZXV8_9BILA|nr:unnamed protein product [Adineta steineri]